MINASHKTLKESFNLSNTITELAKYIRTYGQDNAVTVKKPNRKRRRYQDGGTRICIKTDVRKNTEASYRASVKKMVGMAAYDESIIVPDIPKSQRWDWRW